jgi:hypothetical protein
VSLKEAQQIAEHALKLSSAKEIKEYVAEKVKKILPEMI